MLTLSFIEAMAKAGKKLSIMQIGNLVSVSSSFDREIVECSSEHNAAIISDKLEELYNNNLLLTK